MKYNNQLISIKDKLNQIKSVMVALPSSTNRDKLAAGLTFYLGFKQLGKKVSIVTDEIIKVEQANLFGIGEVKNRVDFGGGGNLTLTLEGVVIPSGPDAGTVPALDKLDWYPEGSNLNLVFHVKPGQQFKPSGINPKYQDEAIDLAIIIGSETWESLGEIYKQNQNLFSTIQSINIDNSSNNTSYASINILDNNAATISEMVVSILAGLGVRLDNDMGTNILNGIYTQTQNLTVNVSPDTFYAVGTAVAAGGVLPVVNNIGPASSLATTINSDQSTVSSFINNVGDAYTPIQQAQVVNSTPNTPVVESLQKIDDTSKQEVPMGEFVGSASSESASPAPDWLTPKIYKGGSLG